MSSDLMVGNPAAGSRSVLNSASPCRLVCLQTLIFRNCFVTVEDLDNPYFSPILNEKSPQLIDQIRLKAGQTKTLGERDIILKQNGIEEVDSGLRLIRTLIRPQQV